MSEVDLSTLAELVQAGGSSSAVARRAIAGDLERVGVGVYADGTQWRALTPRQRHEYRMRAAQLGSERPLVFSHESAAVLLEIPMLGTLPERPHILVPPGSTKSSAVLERTERDLADVVIQQHRDLTSTGFAMTAIDLAARRSFVGGVMAFSHALRFGGVTRDDVADWIAQHRPFRSVRRVERALAHASAKSDSPLEALTLLRCAELGFEPPEQQRAFRIEGKQYFVDFAWDDGQLVVEADGRNKYEDPAILGDREPGDVLWEEKLREDALRAHTRGLGRVTWNDAWSGTGLARTLTRLGVPRVGRRARRLSV